MPDQRTHKRPDARRGPQGTSGILPRVATEPSAKKREGQTSQECRWALVGALTPHF